MSGDLLCILAVIAAGIGAGLVARVAMTMMGWQ